MNTFKAKYFASKCYGVIKQMESKRNKGTYFKKYTEYQHTLMRVEGLRWIDTTTPDKTLLTEYLNFSNFEFRVYLVLRKVPCFLDNVDFLIKTYYKIVEREAK